MERGRLKQRISAVFRASLRTSCSIVNSRKAADAVQEPVYVSRRYAGEEEEEGGVLGGLDRSLSLPPPAAEPLGRRRCRETAAGLPRLSVDCSTCRPTTVKAKKKEKGAPETGAFCEEAGGEGEGRKCPPAPADQSPSYRCFKQMQEELKREEKKLAAKKKKEKKLLSNGYGFTSSSEDSDNDDDLGDLFSSDGDQGLQPRKGALLKERGKEGEAEALFSSRSISSDSSEFYYRASRRHAGKKKQPSRRRQRKPRKGDQQGDRRSRHTSCDESFRPAISISSCSPSSHAVPAAAQLVEEDEVDVGREGFAVEKQSSDPYADFRSSMLEMIVEKQLFGARELEQLLCCYLVLNSPCHHSVIFEVFSEICETLFLN